MLMTNENESLHNCLEDDQTAVGLDVLWQALINQQCARFQSSYRLVCVGSYREVPWITDTDACAAAHL